MLKNKYLIIALVLSLGVIGMASTDMYVPALPNITKSLDTTDAAVKLTVTFYLFGFSLSPLFLGPLADRFGRKPVILSCASIAFTGTLLALSARQIDTLMIARLIQGGGMGVTTSLCRTVMRDLFHGADLARIFSVASLFLILAPAMAPIAGGYLQLHFGWRSIFMVQGGLLLTLALLIAWKVPETAETLNPKATRVAVMLQNYIQLLKHPVFIGFNLCASMAVSGVLVFYTLSPFIMQQKFHVNPVQYGWMVSSITLTMVLSRIINLALVRLFSSEKRVLITLGLMLTGSLLLFIVNLGPWHSPLTLILPMIVFVLGSSSLLPNSSAGALESFKHIGGAAGALYGSLQVFGAFLATLIASKMTNSVFVLAGLLLSLTLAALIPFVLLTLPALIKKEQEKLETPLAKKHAESTCKV